jgi:hypothetical protein
MSILELYVERAIQCRQDAEATTLANVRERCLRSASAWESMADRLRVTETYRANDATRKAEQAAPAHVLERLLTPSSNNVG